MKYLFIRIICPCILGLVIAGCAGSPLQLSIMNPEKLKTVDIIDLANGYAFLRSERIYNELHQRKVFSDQEWDLIRNKQIAIGMSEYALIASRGTPGVWGGINRTVYSFGVHKQYIYRACSDCTALYVYVENGKVTSWQD